MLQERTISNADIHPQMLFQDPADLRSTIVAHLTWRPSPAGGIQLKIPQAMRWLTTHLHTP